MRWLVVLLAGWRAPARRLRLGGRRDRGQRPASSRSWPPRTSGAASRRSSAATACRCGASSSTPTTDPHSYEPTAAGRAHDGGRAAGDRQRGRLRRMGLEAARRQPAERARDAERRRSCSGCSEGDNPHRWYFPADVYAVVEADRPTTTSSLEPGATGYFAQRAAHLRNAEPRALQRSCAARSARATPARRWATARASSRASAKTSA